jgi:hypothetical protein
MLLLDLVAIEEDISLAINMATDRAMFARLA